MKLLCAITTLFAASAVAAKYRPGQDCRTNKGCDQNCIDSKWSVVIIAGDARMVCDPTTLDSTRYVVASCFAGDSEDFAKGEEKVKDVCQKANGKGCATNCLLTTPASKEDSLTSRYLELCTGHKNPDGSSYNGFVHVYPTKEEADKTIYNTRCKSQFP